MDKTKTNDLPAEQIRRDKLLQTLYGTFEAEDISISKATKRNLDRIISGQASYRQIIDELIKKYGGNS